MRIQELHLFSTGRQLSSWPFFLDGKAVAAAPNGNVSVPVRPADGNSPSLQSRQRFLMGKLVRVIGAARYDGVLRPHGLQKWRRRRRLAAVVPYFQYGRLQFFAPMTAQDLPFRFGLGIAGKEEGKIAICHLADEGFVIFPFRIAAAPP